jgi:hypothetical protein
MQGIFFLGLMLLLFSLISSVTVGVVQNSAQIKQARIKGVEKMFSDIETAIVKGILQEQADLTTVDMSDPTFVRQLVGWSDDQMRMDPWKNQIQIYYFDERVAIFADPDDANNFAIAPIIHIALISPGPNRELETIPPGDITTIKQITKQGDDIVYSFSTYDAMNNMWNRASAVDEVLEGVALKGYQEQLRLFNDPDQPNSVLGQFYRCLVRRNPSFSDAETNCTQFDASTLLNCGQDDTTIGDGNDSTIVVTSASNCWKEDSRIRQLATFPSMASRGRCVNTSCTVSPAAIGGENEVERDPFFDRTTGQAGVVISYDDTKPDELRLVRNYNEGGWQVSREIVVKSEVGLVAQ